MEHAKHIFRAALLLILIAIGFIVVRWFAVPRSFGMYGHYRFNSIAEHMAQLPVHGSATVCQECHDEIWQKRAEGKHTLVSCETCHASLAFHIKEDEKIAAMPVDRSYALCARCHQRLTARPESFPQVVIKNHLMDKEVEMSESVCLECHNAHDPSLEDLP